MKMPTLPIICVVLATGLVVAHGRVATAEEAGNSAAGKERYLVNCVNCHGKTGKGMASFPPILGKEVDYIADRLAKYRAREKVGPNSAIMMSLAKDLSDADIANLAAYISVTFK